MPVPIPVPAPGRPVRPGTGVWLPPGTSYSLAAAGPGPLRLDSVLLPASAPGTESAGTEPDGAGGPLLADLAEQPAEITGDRQFRVLFAPGQGCAAATQFVGEIPPGQAPFHTHTYDEVVLILAGEGVLHVGDEDRPLAPGSCLHLAPGTPQDQDPDRVIPVDLLARAGEPLVHRPCQRVAGRRPVEHERQHRAVPRDQDLVGRRHALSGLASVHRAVMPPSMTSSVPVTKRASSEAR